MVDIANIKSTLNYEVNWFDPGKVRAGIDIGKSSVKVALLKESPTGIRILELSTMPIARPDDESAERQNVVISDAIKKLLPKLKNKISRVNAVISRPSLNLRNLVLPNMPPEELKESIKWEIEQNVPCPVEELNIDYLVAGKLVKAGVENVEIEVVAVRKEEVGDFLNVFTGIAGLKLLEINITPFALWNIFQKTCRWKEEDKIALIDIGAETTTINVFYNNVLRFTRDILWGSSSLTSTIMQQLNLPEGEAEKLKIETGINDATALHPVILPVLKQLSTDIQRSFDYYKAQFHVNQIDRVVLFGGGARLKNLDRFLSEEIGIMVEPANLSTAFLYDPKAIPAIDQDSLTYAAAIGTALSEGPLKKINLLPANLRLEKKTDLKKFLPQAGAGVLTAAMLCHLTAAVVEEKKLKKSKLASESILKNWQDKSAAENKIKFISNITAQQKKWELILTAITESIPDYVWLTELNINENAKVCSLTGEGTSEILVVEFIRNLERSDYFKNIKLEVIERKASGTVSFVSSCRW